MEKDWKLDMIVIPPPRDQSLWFLILRRFCQNILCLSKKSLRKKENKKVESRKTLSTFQSFIFGIKFLINSVSSLVCHWLSRTFGTRMATTNDTVWNRILNGEKDGAHATTDQKNSLWVYFGKWCIFSLVDSTLDLKTRNNRNFEKTKLFWCDQKYRSKIDHLRCFENYQKR